MMCQFRPFNANINIYPLWQPTEYMYKKFGKEGAESWEAYATSVREMMCEQTGLAKCDMSHKNMLSYYDHMRGARASPFTDKDDKKKS